MTSTRAGIAHQPLGQTVIEYLPLEQVSVKASVADVSSCIVLTQTFYNPSDAPTGRAKYVFPLPATAAVCAFRLELEGGSVVVGEIQEKEEAQVTFTNALNQGQTTALVEWATDDIFTISVGSIPATTRVTAHLTFVMDLLDEGAQDHVRLQLPMHIAARYGMQPTAVRDASAADTHTRVHISIDVQTSGELYKVEGSTRSIERWRHEVHSRQEKQTHMSASWESSEFLENDFIITIHAEGLDKPRCFAEVFNNGRNDSTVAMQLTLVPKFLAPKVPSQEYIFVIDRSGSMQGDSMETAKLTLSVLLRLLPSTQTTFNIFSFGTTVSALWQTSRGLDQASLVEATSHVDSMNANLGGTEILRALEAAFNSRGRDRPAAIFLLTDGRVHDNDRLNGFISRGVQDSPPEAPVRLFVLGIGTGVSSDVCSRLARQGDGEYLFAASAEHIQGKCARLLNAAFSKNIERINVDWGVGSSSAPASITAENGSNLSASIPALAPLPPVQQAPYELTRISSGIRFTVFAIISSRSVPTSVKLTTRVQGDIKSMEWNVGVTKVKLLPNDALHIRMVHTLAARKLIMELDDGAGLLPLPAVGNTHLPVSEGDLRRAGIIRLGLAYRLVSKHTSFVAVQKDDKQARTRRRRSGSWTKIDMEDVTDEDVHPTREEPGLTSGLLAGYDMTDDVDTSAKGWGREIRYTVPPPRQSQPTLGDSTSAYARPASSLNPFLSPLDEPVARAPSPVFQVVQTPRMVLNRIWKAALPPNPAGGAQYGMALPRPSKMSISLPMSATSSWRKAFHTSSAAPSPIVLMAQTASPSSSPTPPSPPALGPWMMATASQPKALFHKVWSPAPSVPSSASSLARTDKVHALALEMAIDGSFAATPLLTQLVGAVVLSMAATLGVDARVWTTAVAVAYMRRHLESSEPELLALVVDKARAFAEAQGIEAERFDELVRKAAPELDRT